MCVCSSVCASVCCALAPPNTYRQLHKRPDPDPGLFWSPRDSQRCATHWKFWAAKRATSFKPACLLLLPLLLLFCIVALCCSQWQWQCERGTRKMVFSKQIGCQEGGTTSKANRKFITKQTKVLNTRQYTIYIYISIYKYIRKYIYKDIYNHCRLLADCCPTIAMMRYSEISRDLSTDNLRYSEVSCHAPPPLHQSMF